MKMIDYYRNFASLRQIVFTNDDASKVKIIEREIIVPANALDGQVITISFDEDYEADVNLA